MSLETRIQVVGVKDALRTLNSLDKSLRHKFSRRYSEIVQPTVSTARSLTPTREPMSGWKRTWDPQAGRQGGSTGRTVFPYLPQKATQAIKPFISGKRPREFAGVVRNLSAFGIQWRMPSATLFDQARHPNTRQGAVMVQTLDRRFGTPSRIMWRAWSRTEDDVTGNVAQLVEEIMFAANKRVAISAAARAGNVDYTTTVGGGD